MNMTELCTWTHGVDEFEPVDIGFLCIAELVDDLAALRLSCLFTRFREPRATASPVGLWGIRSALRFANGIPHYSRHHGAGCATLLRQRVKRRDADYGLPVEKIRRRWEGYSAKRQVRRSCMLGLWRRRQLTGRIGRWKVDRRRRRAAPDCRNLVKSCQCKDRQVKY